jgi:hypothetical protein
MRPRPLRERVGISSEECWVRVATRPAPVAGLPLIRPRFARTPSRCGPDRLPCAVHHCGEAGIIAARQAFGEWKAHRHVDRDKAREEFAILKDAMKEVRALSRLLALTPASARQSTRPDDPETSYYDRTRLLEGRRDGEPN